MHIDTTAVPDIDPGLAEPGQIEALADQLSRCADALHARVLRDLRAHHDGHYSEAQQAVVRGLFDQEIMLRQRANGLYADAAIRVVQGLDRSQQELMELTAAAGDRISQIAMIGNAAGLVSALAMLASAAASGQAAAIIVALEKILYQMQRIDALAPEKPA